MGTRRELTCRFEHLLGARAHGNVVSEVHPSNDPIGIEEKFGRARNVDSFGSSARVQHIVPANHLGVGIGQQRKRVPKLLRLAFIDIRRIDADSDNANAARIEIRKLLLETPQLGVTQGSPKSAIENQRNRLRSRRSAQEIAKPDRISILIQQNKIRRLLSNSRGAS
jgi:hypothetical protein